MANWFGTVASAAGSLGKSFSLKTTNLAKAVRSWSPIFDDDTLEFFAVLFAVAAIEEGINEAELQMILSSPEAQKLSANQQKTLQSYSHKPPPLEKSMQALSKAKQELKFGLMFCILNLVYINGKMSHAEKEAISLAQETFNINDVQIKVIRDFIQILDKDELAKNQKELREAVERMTSVGIPVNALATSHEQAMNQMEYSEENFLHKMKMFGFQAGQVLVEQAYILWYALHSSNTPVPAKMVIVGALAYWILPVDMVPDVLPAVGLSDDFTTIATAVVSVANSITPDIRTKAKQQTNALFSGPDGFSPDAVKSSGNLA